MPKTNLQQADQQQAAISHQTDLLLEKGNYSTCHED